MCGSLLTISIYPQHICSTVLLRQSRIKIVVKRGNCKDYNLMNSNKLQLKAVRRNFFSTQIARYVLFLENVCVCIPSLAV